MELLAQARDAVESMASCQFKIGDIALAIEPMHARPGGRASGTYATLRQFADEVGLAFDTLLTYREVAAAWPSRQRSLHNASFSVHHQLAHMKKRFEVIKNPPPHPADGSARWTTDNAARAANHQVRWQVTTSERVQRIHDLSRDPEVASEAARHLLLRPEVAERVVEDDVARHAFDRARIEHSTKQAHRVEGEVSQKAPIVDRVQRRMDFVEVLGACASFVSSVHRSLPSVIADGISEADKEVLEIELGNVRDAVDWCADAVRTGATGLDAQLARLLSEEGGSDD